MKEGATDDRKEPSGVGEGHMMYTHVLNRRGKGVKSPVADL
jgi:hypothetical protein